MTGLAALDGAVCARMRRLPHYRASDGVLRAASAAGDHAAGWLALSLAGAAVDRGHRAAWLDAAVTVAAAQYASVQVKVLVPRARPALAGLPPLARVTTPQSFPSSHAATACAAIGAFDGLLPGWLLRGVAVAYGCSRPYLGVHYPSDVLAGALLGCAVAARRA